MHEEGWMPVFLTYIFNSFDCPVFIAHHFIKIISSLENSNSTAKSKLNFETHYFRKRGCVVPENIHTSPTKGFFFPKNSPPPPHPSGHSNKALHISLNFWALQNPPPPRKFPSLLWGEYGYFLDVHNAKIQTALENWLILGSVT